METGTVPKERVSESPWQEGQSCLSKKKQALYKVKNTRLRLPLCGWEEVPHRDSAELRWGGSAGGAEWGPEGSSVVTAFGR